MAIITTEIKIPKRIVHVNGWPNRTCRKITNSGGICYLCCPNLLPLLPKLHLMNEIGKRCKRLPLKKWVFFFFFYSLVYVFVSSVYHCKRNFPVGVLRLQKDIWRTPSWLNAESVTLDEHTQENIWDVVKDGEQIENKILNGME